MTALIPASDPSERLIAQWLHGRSRHTRTAYAADVARFRRFCPAPLDRVTLADLQAWADALAEQGLAPASRARQLSALKSLFAFGHRLGLLPANIGAALRLPPLRSPLAARILTEPEVQRLLALETHPRNRALLLVLYAGGLRVSELVGLRWADCHDRDAGGVLDVLGKGAKLRHVLLPASVWAELLRLRGAPHEGPVFRSRGGGALSVDQVQRLVRAAAKRAGIDKPVSPHFLRHAHASHALDRGAPVHLVQATLGHASLSTTSRYAHARPSESSARFLGV